jgi:hypothetical protein
MKKGGRHGKTRSSERMSHRRMLDDQIEDYWNEIEEGQKETPVEESSGVSSFCYA